MTPFEQTQQKRKLLENLFKKIYVDFSIFKSIKTFKDVQLGLGREEGELLYAYPKEQLEKQITHDEIKEIEKCEFQRFTQNLQRLDKGQESQTFESLAEEQKYPQECFASPCVEPLHNNIVQSEQLTTQSWPSNNPLPVLVKLLNPELNYEGDDYLLSDIEEDPGAFEFVREGVFKQLRHTFKEQSRIKRLHTSLAGSDDKNVFGKNAGVVERGDNSFISAPPKDLDAELKELYKLERISRTKNTYFHVHQSKEIRIALHKFLHNKHRIHHIQAGTGVGKTFIAGGLIEQLWNPKHEFFKGCISPWPCIYITRASIVEQTERVMTRYKDCDIGFGLQNVRQIKVINIEQLRAEFGKFFLKEETVVVKGISHIVWKWIPFMAPRFVVVDESHLAKNPESTQSQIIYSMSELPDTKILSMSATSFMKVSEGGYFAVQTHKEI